MRRLLDYDAFSGVATYHEYDHQSKTTTVGRFQDVSPVLDLNKATKSMGNNTLSQKGTAPLHLHARIPVVWREAFIKKYGQDIFHPGVRKQFWKELEHPDNKHLKTTWKRHYGS